MAPADPKPARSLRALWQGVFYVSWPFFILSLLLPVYGKQVGASVVEIGLFFSAFSLVTVLLRPLVGWGIDRYGRRPFLLAGLLGYALTMLSFAFIDQVWSMVAARVLQGVSSSFVWLAANAITADLAGNARRGRAFGSLAQASARGSIVGTFVGFAVLSSGLTLGGNEYALGGWPLLFLGYALVALIGLACALRGVSETRPAAGPRASQPIAWSRNWALLLLVTLVTGASWALVSPILIIFLQDRLAVGVDVLSWAFLPSALVWALLPSHLGRLADRFGRKPLMVAGLVAAALSSLLIPSLTSVVALAVLWAFQALCYAAGDPAEQALVADLTGGDQRGRAYGIYVACNDLGATIGPLGGAWLYQHLGAQAPFQANGLVLALCAVAIGLLLREARQSATPPQRG